MIWTSPWQWKIYFWLSLVAGPWAGRVASCSVLVPISSPMCWQDSPFLISSQNGSVSKTAIVIHRKKPWPDSKASALRGQCQPNTQLRSRGEISQQLNNGTRGFQDAPACWVLEIVQQRNKIQGHFSLDLLPSLFHLRWRGVDNSLFLVCFKFKA